MHYTGVKAKVPYCKTPRNLTKIRDKELLTKQKDF